MERLPAVESIVDPAAREKASQQLTLEAACWLHLRGTLDQGLNPLADSAGQIALMRVETVDPYYAQFADEMAAAASEGYELVVPRLPQEDQIDLYLQLQNRLLDSLSDPTLHRSFDEMGNHAFTPAVRARVEAGDAYLGPDALRSPPSSPPPPLDVAEPGAAGYDFRKAFDSLESRNRFYRDEFNFRGHLYMREYLRELDAKGFALLAGLGGSADDITSNFFGHHTPSIYDTLSRDGRAGGGGRRPEPRRRPPCRDGRAGEDGERERSPRSRPAPASSRARPSIAASTQSGLRGWLQDQAHRARDMHMAAATDEAGQRAAWEWGYYLRLVQALDEGVDPLATSNEMIAARMVDEVEPYYAQFADEVADAAADGVDLAIDRPRAEDEVDLYVKLQDHLLETLADPAFHRSTSETGADAFTAVARSRSDPGPGFLARDSLRRLAGGEVPPPLPAADSAGGAVYVDEIRDRRFARSALAASEDTLQRQAVNLAEGDPLIRSSSPEPGSALPEPSHRYPPRTPRQRRGSGHRRALGAVGAGAVRGARRLPIAHRAAPPPRHGEGGSRRGSPKSRGSRDFRCRTTPMLARPPAIRTPVHSIRPPRRKTWSRETSTTCGRSRTGERRRFLRLAQRPLDPCARGEDGNPTGRTAGPDDLHDHARSRCRDR